MKKTLILTMILFLSLTMISFFKTSASDYNIKQIKEGYDFLKNKVEKNNMMSEEEKKEASALYSELFTKISMGKKGQEREYAEQLKIITKGTVEFNENDVYNLADDFSKIFKDMAEGIDDFGVQEIKVVENNQNELVLNINYIDVRGYGARMMKENEMEYSGKYNGSLGKNRIEITFYDSFASEKFISKYPLREVCQLYEDTSSNVESKLKIKSVYTADHSLIIYIGSDEPIYFADQSCANLSRPIGNIQLTLKKQLVTEP